ncbi:MAG: nucleoside deaminase [Vampirovibrionales bacterium]|nr:nucleoside deaminase [Vampirovibrionales bacterium]
MDRCLEVAREALPDDVPVGAALLAPEGKGWRLIAQAANRRERDQNPIAHAEMLVLIEGARRLNAWRLSGCALIVTLEPCAMCAAAIAQARVSRVVFGADDPLAGACGSRYRLLGQGSDAADVDVMGGVRAEACRAALHDFFSQARALKPPKRSP